MPRHGGHPAGRPLWAWIFLGCESAAFVTYLGGLWLLRRSGRLRAVLVLAVAIQLAPLGAPLLLSTDAWTYWSDARLANPYRDVPRQDPVSRPYVGRHWLDSTTVYGPAFELGSRPARLTESHDVAAWVFKTIAALCVLGCAVLAARRSRHPAFAAAFVGWNPLLAVHFAGGGHNDAWMMALVAVALALGSAGRRQLAGVAWALAVLVKWIPVVLLPLRALEARAKGRRVGHAGFALTVVGVLAAATALWRLEWVQFLAPLARNANRETAFAIPHRLGIPWPVLVAVYLIAYLWLLWEASRGRARLGLATGLLLLAVPYLAPWYAIWAVPLAAGDDDRPAQLLALGLCAYLLRQAVPV